MQLYEVKVDSRRRPTLPSQLVDEIGEEVAGMTLIAHALGPGRFILETPSAARERRRAELRDGFANDDTDADAVSDLRQFRQEDAQRLDRGPSGAAAPGGQQLLGLLGLE